LHPQHIKGIQLRVFIVLVGVKRLEIRHAVPAEHDRLTVDHELLGAVLQRALDNPRIAAGRTRPNTRTFPADSATGAGLKPAHSAAAPAPVLRQARRDGRGSLSASNTTVTGRSSSLRSALPASSTMCSNAVVDIVETISSRARISAVGIRRAHVDDNPLQLRFFPWWFRVRHSLAAGVFESFEPFRHCSPNALYGEGDFDMRRRLQRLF
jgi:hypothetical protein